MGAAAFLLLLHCNQPICCTDCRECVVGCARAKVTYVMTSLIKRALFEIFDVTIIIDG